MWITVRTGGSFSSGLLDHILPGSWISLPVVYNWNSYVTDNDDIYILGDFIYKGTGLDANKILGMLKGRKYLIQGNHEKYLTDIKFNLKLFEWIKDYHVLRLEGGLKIILFHFPILSWDGFNHGSIHLYGHVHNCRKNPEQRKRLSLLGKRAINVGVDENKYFPLSIEKIMKMVE